MLSCARLRTQIPHRKVILMKERQPSEEGHPLVDLSRFNLRQYLADTVGIAARRLIFNLEEEGNVTDRENLTVADQLTKLGISINAEIFVNRVKHAILDPVRPEYPEGFDVAFMELIKDPAVLPILISNHTGHADVVTAADISKHSTELANKVRPAKDPFRGYMITMAASLETANQGIFLQQCTAYGKQLLADFSLSTEAFVRVKDEEKFSIPRENSKYHKIVDAIIQRSEIRTADGLIYYPEASVEGGRRYKDGPEKGQIKGTQKFKFEGINRVVDGAQSNYNRKVLYIVFSSKGANDVLDPSNHNFPTPQAIDAVISPIVPAKSLLQAKVGKLIFHNDLVEQIRQQKGSDPTPEDIGDRLGRICAEGLPLEERGIYRS